MSIVSQDYIMRMIEQFFRALARILAASEAGKLDEALSLIDQTADSLLGPTRRLVDALDAPSAAMLLGEAEKVYVYAMLTAQRAFIDEKLGRGSRAQQGFERALQLHLESWAAKPHVFSTEGAEIAMKHVDVQRLSEKHQRTLVRLLEYAREQRLDRSRDATD